MGPRWLTHPTHPRVLSDVRTRLLLQCLEDIKWPAGVIVQSERFGASLAQALKVYADALRTRRRLRAEAAVGRAGIKMLALVPGLLSVLENHQFIGRSR